MIKSSSRTDLFQIRPKKISVMSVGETKNGEESKPIIEFS